MIVGLEGVIIAKEPTSVHINVSGVIYEVFISLNCYTKLVEGKNFLHIQQIIREDAQVLYGFVDKIEKKLFCELIKINGVGGKVAMAILSTYTPQTFSQILETKDITALKKVPGIGPKSAGRILVEISGFSTDMQLSSSSDDTTQEEAILALESLGFKREDAKKALDGNSGDTTAEKVRYALKKMAMTK